MPELNATLVHRTACTSADGCVDSSGNYLVNGCAQGYEPVLYDAQGTMQVDCIAMCAPIDCYAGHCGPNDANLGGAPPHACTPSDARGTFNVASANNNGDQCAFSWIFQYVVGFVPSHTSDTLGFCIDHSKYAQPSCATLTNPGFGSGSAVGAADLGCVSTATAGLPFAGKPRAALELRLPYHRR
jgi:hypothetical protein